MAVPSGDAAGDAFLTLAYTPQIWRSPKTRSSAKIAKSEPAQTHFSAAVRVLKKR
jgi:hypothetical protein